MREPDEQVETTQTGRILLKITLAVMMLGLLAGSVFFINWLYTPGSFPITKIELVNHLENQQSRELQKVSAQAIKGGFFSLDVEQFRNELLRTLPWVKAVSVRKIWPDRLLVSIEEYKPVVRWQSVVRKTDNTATDNEQYELLSNEGLIFKPELSSEQKKRFNRLALLQGPDGRSKEIMQACYKMNEHLKRIGLAIRKCGMNARRTWMLELVNGMEIKLGKEKNMQKLDRLIRAFNGQLKAYRDLVAYADLRYSNGFSIKWNTSHLLKNEMESSTHAVSNAVERYSKKH